MGVLASIDASDNEEVIIGIECQVITSFENGRSYADSSRDKRELIRVVIYLDLRLAGGEFRCFFNLQHSEKYSTLQP